ncbi:MAG: 50S ribosomal protein L29 [Pseudomonadota bacterium]
MLEMKEITTWDEKNIANKIKALKKDFFNLRMQLNVSGLDKPHQMRDLRRDVARLQTVQTLRKKGLLAAAPKATAESPVEKKKKAPVTKAKKKAEK